MSDTVKLIIEIPKGVVEYIKNNGCLAVGYLDEVAKAIQNSTPLDDVKAEIKSWYWQVEKQSLAKDPCVVDAMVDLFIRTIDNMGKAESEDKE